MKKFFLVVALAAAVTLPVTPAFSQEREGPHTKEGHGMMAEGMH